MQNKRKQAFLILDINSLSVLHHDVQHLFDIDFHLMQCLLGNEYLVTW